jgi:hypothetical protein
MTGCAGYVLLDATCIEPNMMSGDAPANALIYVSPTKGFLYTYQENHTS